MNADVPITLEYYDLIEDILFNFFHAGLIYKEIIHIQIFLRVTIKAEFMFTDCLTPVDLMTYYKIADEIEQEKIDRIERNKKEGYTK